MQCKASTLSLTHLNKLGGSLFAFPLFVSLSVVLTAWFRGLSVGSSGQHDGLLNLSFSCCLSGPEEEAECVCVVAFGNGCLTRPWGAAPIRQNLIKRVSDLLTASQTHTHVLTCSDKTGFLFSFFSPLHLSILALVLSSTFLCFIPIVLYWKHYACPWGYTSTDWCHTFLYEYSLTVWVRNLNI